MAVKKNKITSQQKHTVSFVAFLIVALIALITATLLPQVATPTAPTSAPQAAASFQLPDVDRTFADDFSKPSESAKKWTLDKNDPSVSISASGGVGTISIPAGKTANGLPKTGLGYITNGLDKMYSTQDYYFKLDFMIDKNGLVYKNSDSGLRLRSDNGDVDLLISLYPATTAGKYRIKAVYKEKGNNDAISTPPQEFSDSKISVVIVKTGRNIRAYYGFGSGNDLEKNYVWNLLMSDFLEQNFLNTRVGVYSANKAPNYLKTGVLVDNLVAGMTNN